MKRKAHRKLVLSLLPLLLIVHSCDQFLLYDQFPMDVPDTGGGGTDTTLALYPAAATVGVGNSFTFTAVGGSGGNVFSVSSGSGTIDPATGVYQAPISPQTDEVTITDSAGSAASATVSIMALPQPLSIFPATATIYAGDTINFVASGGAGGYNYAVTTGSGSIVAATGVYTAPGVASSEVITVTDASSATTTATITVIPVASTLSIYPEVAAVLVVDTIGFAASGGAGGYVYSVQSGGGSVNPVSGVYTAPGAAGSAVIEVTDANSDSVTASVTVIASETLKIFPPSLVVTSGSAFQFAASGGAMPYSFSIITPGGPATVGSISVGGLYSAPGTPYAQVLVRVTDNAGATATASVAVVAAGPFGISPSAVTVEENKTITFSGYGGTPGYTYSASPNKGVILNSDYSPWLGTPALPGDTITVTITDSSTPTPNSANASVSIAPATPTDLVADGTAGGPQDVTLTWTDNSNGETGYRIERKMGTAGSYTEITQVGADVTSYDDGGLSPNELYVYRIRAYKSGAPELNSGYSDIAFAFSND